MKEPLPATPILPGCVLQLAQALAFLRLCPFFFRYRPCELEFFYEFSRLSRVRYDLLLLGCLVFPLSADARSKPPPCPRYDPLRLFAFFPTVLFRLGSPHWVAGVTGLVFLDQPPSAGPFSPCPFPLY